MREANDSYQSLATDLKLMTNERDKIMGEKRKLEVSKICVYVWWDSL